MPAAPPLSLILFTRVPQPGRAKTRLIPALGAEGAAELQSQMTHLAVARAWPFCVSAPGRRLVIAYEGGTERDMADWLGPLEYRPQGEGDLGARMQRSISEEFKRGATSVIVIGADCPRLTERVIESAVTALAASDLVFGPARDGGYYLVGLRRSIAEIFVEVPWGTSRVLEESMRRARQAGVEPALLEILPDVDEPHDLTDAQSALEASRTVSVIIPTLNESTNLARLLPRLAASRPHEILVADGGSSDNTVSVAESFGAKLVHARRGRAGQMNAAAAVASGEMLLFLHADTDPPEAFPAIICPALERAGTAAGAFRFTLREPIAGRSLIEMGVALRCHLHHLPYGDQGLFLRRSLFHSIGGFPDMPILEDLEIVHRLRALGRIVVTREAAVTSARRWIEGGLVRTFLRHQLVLLGHYAGVGPERLVRQ